MDETENNENNIVEIHREHDPETARDMALAVIETSPQPLTVKDAVIRAGILNPFEAQVVMGLVRKALKPDGSHFHLTQQSKWLRSAEKWAADPQINVPKGKSVEKVDPRILIVEDAREKIENNPNLSPQFKSRSVHVLNSVSLRGNKKYDKATGELVVENMSILAMEAAMLAKENESLKVRLDEKERHLEEVRRLGKAQEDRLITIIEKLGDKLTTNAVVPVPEAAD